MVDITNVNGVYKPTNITGGHHIVDICGVSLWIPTWVAPLAPGFMIRARPALRSLGRWDSDMPRDWITHNSSAPKRPWKPPGVHRVMCLSSVPSNFWFHVFFLCFPWLAAGVPKRFRCFPRQMCPSVGVIRNASGQAYLHSLRPVVFLGVTWSHDGDAVVKGRQCWVVNFCLAHDGEGQGQPSALLSKASNNCNHISIPSCEMGST